MYPTLCSNILAEGQSGFLLEVSFIFPAWGFVLFCFLKFFFTRFEGIRAEGVSFYGLSKPSEMFKMGILGYKKEIDLI